MVFEKIVDPLLSPLLEINPLWTIVIITLIVTIFITIIYKVATDQKLMKELKHDMKAMQKEMKQLKDKPTEMLAKQKIAMEKNMKYMMHSMKPMIIYFIPLIIVFGWLQSHMAFVPIGPLDEFNVIGVFDKEFNGEVMLKAEGLELIEEGVLNNGEIKWKVKAPAEVTNKEHGDLYRISVSFNEEEHTRNVLITEKRQYEKEEFIVKDSQLKNIKIGYEKLKPLNLFGWRVGWLGTYILFSIVFSLVIRKIFKVY